MKRERDLVKQISPYLRPGQKVVDIGAGSCRLAEELKKQLNLNLTVVDIIDYNKTDLFLLIYDGQTIPFPDEEFEASLIVFVLHHARDPNQVIEEAKRLTASRLIVIEDTPLNWWEMLAWRFWDWALNAAHDSRPAEGLKTTDGWLAFFDQHGLKPESVTHFRTLSPILKMYQHTMFVLTK